MYPSLNTSRDDIKPSGIERFRKIVNKVIKNNKDKAATKFSQIMSMQEIKTDKNLMTQSTVQGLDTEGSTSRRRKTTKFGTIFDKVKGFFNRQSVRVYPDLDISTQDINQRELENYRQPIPRKTHITNLASLVNYIRDLRTKRRSDTINPLIRAKLTSQEIRTIFRQAFYKLRTIHRLKRINDDIILYGTSSNLFDLTTRNRKTVKSIVYPNFDNHEENQSKDVLKWYIIHPKSKFKEIWMILLIILLLYNALITPYTIAFIEEEYLFLEFMEYIINFLFCLDLIINCLSAFYNEEEVLQTKPQEIIKKYIKTWFLVDLISSMPFDLIGSIFYPSSSIYISSKFGKNNVVKLVRIPKLYKLFRLTKIIKIFKIFNDDAKFSMINLNSDSMRLLYFGIKVSILVHIMGCMWYLLDKFDDFNPDTWVVRMDLLDSDNITLYITSIYYIVTTLVTVGYGDITSLTFNERIFSIFWTVIGVGFYSFTIGILSTSFTSQWDRESSLKRKLAIMNEFSKEIKAPKQLKQQIKRILEYNSKRNCFTWADKKGIFDEIPINLRHEIIMNMQGEILSDIPFFKEHSDKYFIVKVTQLLKPMFFKANASIWREGTSPDAVYFLLRGKVNYISYEAVSDTNSKENNTKVIFNTKLICYKAFQQVPLVFKRMIAGSYFGEIEIILRKKRSHTLQAAVDSEMFYITRQDFDNVICKEFPHIVEEMKQIALEREKRNWNALNDLRKLMKKSQTTHTTLFSLEKVSHIDLNNNKSRNNLITPKINTKININQPIEEEKSPTNSPSSKPRDSTGHSPESSIISSNSSINSPNTKDIKSSLKKRTSRSNKLLERVSSSAAKKNSVLKRLGVCGSTIRRIIPGGVLRLSTDDQYERQPSIERSCLRSILASFISDKELPKDNDQDKIVDIKIDEEVGLAAKKVENEAKNEEKDHQSHKKHEIKKKKGEISPSRRACLTIQNIYHCIISPQKDKNKGKNEILAERSSVLEVFNHYLIVF